jgi:hypothetical protein
MATLFPAEVGSRGTIASLVSQEIEYFNSLKLGKKENKPKNKKKNKVDVSHKLLPSMCKAVDIAENFHVQRTVRIGCKNLNMPDCKELLQV